MTGTFQSLPSSSPTGLRSAIVRTVAFILGRIAGLTKVFANRRHVRELLELDERALKDIGLIRNDVLGALAEPMSKDPSVVLMVRSVERRSRVRAMALPRRLVTAGPVAETCR